MRVTASDAGRGAGLIPGVESPSRAVGATVIRLKSGGWPCFGSGDSPLTFTGIEKEQKGAARQLHNGCSKPPVLGYPLDNG